MTSIYNLPVNTLESGRNVFWEICKEHFGQKAISILEIGVFQAQCISSIPQGLLNISSYTGVDPYLCDTNDSYRGNYWNEKIEANRVFLQAEKIFRKNGGYCIEKPQKTFMILAWSSMMLFM